MANGFKSKTLVGYSTRARAEAAAKVHGYSYGLRTAGNGTQWFATQRMTNGVWVIGTRGRIVKADSEHAPKFD